MAQVLPLQPEPFVNVYFVFWRLVNYLKLIPKSNLISFQIVIVAQTPNRIPDVGHLYCLFSPLKRRYRGGEAII